jgi:hypothetical protein
MEHDEIVINDDLEGRVKEAVLMFLKLCPSSSLETRRDVAKAGQ